MSVTVTCEECQTVITGTIHARGIMRARDGALVVTGTAHYHWPCLLAWAARMSQGSGAIRPDAGTIPFGREEKP